MATTLSATSRPNATQAATPIAKSAVPQLELEGTGLPPNVCRGGGWKEAWETPAHSPVTPMRAIKR